MPATIDLKKLEEEWEQDCTIDKFRPDIAAENTPKLHSKYLNLLNIAKNDLKQSQYEYAILFKKRTEWYEGHLSQEEMDELNWAYDPFDGKLVKTKQQKDLYYNSDPYLRKGQKNIEECENIVKTIESILENIKWRTQTIRCIIDWAKFQSGM